MNPESSITDIQSPQMNAPPLIRLYFDILSNDLQESSRLSISSFLKKIQLIVYQRFKILKIFPDKHVFGRYKKRKYFVIKYLRF